MTTEAIEKINQQALATFDGMLEQDAADFQDQFATTDYAIPFLQVLQSKSPQAEEGAPEYIDGAKAGMFLLTTSKEVFSGKEGTEIVPVAYKKTWIEWKLRERGGGFVAEHAQDGAALSLTCTKDDKNRLILPSGNQLVETASWVVLVLTDNGAKPAMMSLTSTQLKKSRHLVSMIDERRVERNGRKLRPPMFYNVFKATSVYESNDKGSWYGYVFAPSGALEDRGQEGLEVYQQAKMLRESVEKGSVKTAEPQPDTTPF